MQSRTCRPAWGCCLVAVLMLLFCGVAQAQELEGTWKLVMRKLSDGTTLTPPAVLGVATMNKGMRQIAVFWHTPEGKPASYSGMSSVKMTGTEWTETLLFGVLDDGSGKAPAYNLTGDSKTVPVTREGPRIAFKLPFEPVSSVIEGDKWTATLEGFVDYWERVR
jgi:hypothetical protein